jgi:hypothetical protein
MKQKAKQEKLNKINKPAAKVTMKIEPRVYK